MSGRSKQTYLIEVDGIQIEVTRKAVRGVSLRVGADGRVRMSVPWRVGKAEASAIAARHAAWAREKLEARSDFVPATWTTGEVHSVWGVNRTVALRVDPDLAPRSEGARLDGQEIAILVCPEHAGDDDQAVSRRRELAYRLQKELVRRRTEDLLLPCQEIVGAAPTGITFRRMSSRWGSCTPATGRIRLNTELLAFPEAYLRMVLIHELCHLHVADHGPRFQALMDASCPGWRELQAHLDANPPRFS